MPRQFIQLIRCSNPIDVHTAVVLVAHPAAHSDRESGFLNEPAETYTLHAA